MVKTLIKSNQSNKWVVCQTVWQHVIKLLCCLIVATWDSYEGVKQFSGVEYK